MTSLLVCYTKRRAASWLYYRKRWPELRSVLLVKTDKWS